MIRRVLTDALCNLARFELLAGNRYCTVGVAPLNAVMDVAVLGFPDRNSG